MNNQETRKNVALIYFSPTGTTKKTLLNIATNLDMCNLIHHDLTNIEHRKDNLVLSKKDVDLALVGMPCYEGRIPKLMRSYFSDTSFIGVPTIPIICYGNRIVGKALYQLSEILKHQGANIIGLGTFIGEHSFTDGVLDIARGRPDEQDCQDALDFASEINQFLSLNKALNSISLENIDSSFPFLMRLIPEGMMAQFVLPSKIDPNACNNCGVCANSCPVGAIDPVTLKINRKNCIHCLSCVKKCPQSARKMKYLSKFVVYNFMKSCQDVRKVPLFYLNQ